MMKIIYYAVYFGRLNNMLTTIFQGGQRQVLRT
jgi:hypothetical protein